MSACIQPREEWCVVEPAERETTVGRIAVPNEALGGDIYRIVAVGPGTRENMAWWREHAPPVGARVVVIGHGGVVQCRVGGRVQFLVRGDCITGVLVEDESGKLRT